MMDFINSPDFTGLIAKANPDKNTNKFSFVLICIPCFFVSMFHLTNNINQLMKIVIRINGKNFKSKLMIFSYTNVKSEKIKKVEYNTAATQIITKNLLPKKSTYTNNLIKKSCYLKFGINR